MRSVILALSLLSLALALAACGGRSAPGQADGHVPRDAWAGDGAPPADARPTDAGAPDGGPPDCAALDLHACRLRPGCVADLCYACSCTPSFEQCRPASDPAYQCPEYDCPQPLCCQESAECQAMVGDCAPPGTPWACGMCNPDPGDCATDTDCGSGDLCEPIPCSCNGASLCVPGCTPQTVCAPGTTCSGGDHPRCLPSACSAGAPCPPDFDCENGACARRGCTSDLECDHFCVAGSCYDGYGECRGPVP